MQVENGCIIFISRECIKLSEAFMVLGGNQKKQPAHLYDLVTTVPFYMPVPCIKPGE